MEAFDLAKLRVGMTREEVVSAFGKPDLMGGTSLKYRTPSIYRYGNIECFFKPWKAGGLIFVMEVDGPILFPVANLKNSDTSPPAEDRVELEE